MSLELGGFLWPCEGGKLASRRECISVRVEVVEVAQPHMLSVRMRQCVLKSGRRSGGERNVKKVGLGWVGLG